VLTCAPTALCIPVTATGCCVPSALFIRYDRLPACIPTMRMGVHGGLIVAIWSRQFCLSTLDVRVRFGLQDVNYRVSMEAFILALDSIGFQVREAWCPCWMRFIGAPQLN